MAHVVAVVHEPRLVVLHVPVELDVNVAAQLFATSIVTVTLAVEPAHEPLQLVNVAPVSGVAVKTTEEP